MAEIKFLSYTGLSQYDALIKGYVNDAVATGIATSFKGVSLSEGKLQFWTELPMGTEEKPAYEVTLPKEDLTHFMELVDGAVEGNIASFGANGQVIDGNVKLADLATKAEVKEVADALDAYEEANDAAVKEVKDAVEALDEKVGDLPEGTDATTVIEYINKKTEGIATDAALAELQDTVDAIEADYLTSVDKTELSDAIVAEKERAEAAEKVNADAIAAIKEDVDAFFLNADMTESAKDTLKELQEYIASDETGAAAMAASIKENADDIDALEGRMDTVEGAVATKAEQADLEAEVERATKAEAQALTDAKAYTDAEVLKDRNRLDALEAKFDGEDSVADQIGAALEEAKEYTDALAEGAVADNTAAIEAINDAETGILKQAKDYVDGKDSAMNTRVEALEEASATHATAAALADEVQARKDADAAIEAKIGEVAEGKTVVEMIAGADAEVRELIEALDENKADKDQVAEDIADAVKAEEDARIEAVQGVQDAVDELAGTHAEDKEALEAADKALSDRLDVLEAVEHVEITEAEIKALFGITE